MRLIDYLEVNEIKITKKLEEILAKAALDIYPNMTVTWSKDEVSEFILHIDLIDKDINEIIIRAARYSKIWNFS